jgi:LDH2 family malate/lactate/ureidoglycolate dehydrogenase
MAVETLTLAGVGVSAAVAASGQGLLPWRMSRLLHHLAGGGGATQVSLAAGVGEATGGGKSYEGWVGSAETMRIPVASLQVEYERVLVNKGVLPDRAALVARIIAENQVDGVYSHGLNRFGAFLGQLTTPGPGQTQPNADPEVVSALGALEQWDGKMGMGPYNSHMAMSRAIELAKANGVGVVSLRNTNHWQRGGAYGLQAADAGMIGICWTNTSANMPPWGSKDVVIGNNPFVMAVPRPSGGHVLLDMATSQFANGKLEILKTQGQRLVRYCRGQRCHAGYIVAH